MDFESRLATVIKKDNPATDPEDFIARLNSRCQKQIAARQQFKSGIIAGILVIAVGLLSQFQINSTTAHLNYLEQNYLTMEERDIREQFLEEATVYLFAHTDDIWATLEFFDEIDFDPVTTFKE
ncbi:MAG: hypothetical protein HQ562_11205 [Candidatus Marinimicrobia bacterium]|nr:hypothetical protein [Candidatus Neomarinimicrobiota bacterium]